MSDARRVISGYLQGRPFWKEFRSVIVCSSRLQHGKFSWKRDIRISDPELSIRIRILFQVSKSEWKKKLKEDSLRRPP
jgi:hypothetical protein